MGDVGEAFRAYRKSRAKKRQGNRDFAPEFLNQIGVKFESKNLGAHLIVQGLDSVIDFWPGTGKFYIRNKKKYSRGIENLIKYCVSD